MLNTLRAIQALIGVEAESVSLEFKDGTKLDGLSERAKTELITDVTAFANAGGGTIIYGVQEQQHNGQSLAAAISPVTDVHVTQDRLRDIIHSNTDPALRGFSITPIAANGGTVFVVEVDEGDTAYQNKRDQKFYNRVDASARPMYAFAIRDVMNRRTRPHVDATLRIHRDELAHDRHVYVVAPELQNTGNLTANHWVLRVGLPTNIGRVGPQVGDFVRPLGETRPGGHQLSLFEFSSDRVPANAGRVLPGDTYSLGQGQGLPQLLLVIQGENAMRAIQVEPPLIWRLYVDDAPARSGEVPYGDWSVW
ncbi:ATP-binding protein [Paraburkholderia nemoris]|uniref:AlbA family DNA-binding domain-containing protein n=1 Tax=Paraburkholderia nemoris TaxID=2793076 RepID=UPI0038BCCF60